MTHFFLKKRLFPLLFFLFFISGAMSACNSVGAEDVVVETAVSATRPDGAIQLNIPLDGSLQNGAWSPDSSQLLFTNFRGGYNIEPADLYIFTLEDETIRMLVNDGSGNVNLPGSAWNKVTNQITFSSSRDPHDEIYTIYDGGEANDEWQITNRNDFVSYEPSFSPDGEWVLFESHPVDVEGDGVITTYKIDDTQPYRALTAIGDDCRQPNWSPANDLLLYQKLSGGQWDIWVMAPDGTDQRQLTTGAGDKTDASFSPDGKWIVYSADEGELEFANLFILATDGGQPVRLTTFDGYDGAPSWSPDGRYISFESAAGDPDEAGATTLWKIAVPDAFRPRLLFDGGFETGDEYQWASVGWNLDRPLSEQMQIVTDPVRQGEYAAKTIVHDGDEFMDTSGERVQFERTGPDERQGDEYWYAWSTFFPDDWQAPNDWLLIIDWHATYANVCQPLQLEIDNDNAITAHMLAGDVTGYDCYDGSGSALNQSELIVGQITTGEWNDFIIHVKWSVYEDGLVEIWHKLESETDFAPVLRWDGVPTLQYMGDPANPDVPYLILAHYRDDSNTHTSLLYHDGFRMADSAADLAEDGLYVLPPDTVYLPMVQTATLVSPLPKRPFPQHLTYATGTIRPNHRSQSQQDDDVRAAYDEWKAAYLIADGTDNDGDALYRISHGSGDPWRTVSEGQGYGMIIVAHMAGYEADAQAIFDGLWQFARAHPSQIDGRFMAWQVPEDASTGIDSAFDGDADIAYGLLLADAQWGSAGDVDYAAEAAELINAIYESTIGADSQLPEMGDWVEADDVSHGQYSPRSSDFMPAHFRSYGRFTANPVWNDVLVATQAAISDMQTTYSPIAGLLPDFIVPVSARDHRLQPAPPHHLEGENDGRYAYNAGRDPWRIATDGLLNDDAVSQAQAQKMANWIVTATGGNPANIKAGYHLDGTPLASGDYFSTFFAAPFGTAAMTTPANQQFLNDVYDAVYNTREDYYEDSVTLLCLLLMTGNYWDETAVSR